MNHWFWQGALPTPGVCHGQETNLKWRGETSKCKIDESSNRQLLEEFFSNQRSYMGSLVRRNRASRRGAEKRRRYIDKRMICLLKCFDLKKGSWIKNPQILVGDMNLNRERNQSWPEYGINI